MCEYIQTTGWWYGTTQMLLYMYGTSKGKFNGNLLIWVIDIVNITFVQTV